MVEKDMVNHPAHYTKGGVETIDFIKAKFTGYGFRAYLLGNVVKYISRWNKKGGSEDLRKAIRYIEILLDNETN